MGFDINLCLELFLCPITGKPFYYSYNKTTRITEKIYAIPDTQIPIHLHKYLVGRGHLFHAYTEHFNEQDIFKTDVRTFLNEYPDWETVMESQHYTDEYADAWNEDDHLAFKELLEFLVHQEATYTILWSY
jgi:hypothetical protein